MAKIRGITVQIGGDTSGLSKALSGVNKEVSDTKKQLKDVERLLKMDPGNVELLRQKQQLLGDAVESTSKKLETLKEVERQVQEEFERGNATEAQYNAVRREIEATRIELRQLNEQADEVNNALKNIDDDALEDVADAAEDVGEELENAVQKASSFKDMLKAELIVEGAERIVDGLKDVAEESKEYMKIMGSLEVSSANAGYSAEETGNLFKKLYGVLGDNQTAATTVANLQALGIAQEDLEKITDATIGAWATYGDSIPIDGLAEAINETVKTGAVTGTLADVLNWAGVSEDGFNKKLATMTKESDRVNVILEELAKQGLMDAGQAWRENNEALVESNEANAELQEQLAELGEKILPIMTMLTEAVAGFLEIFNQLDPATQGVILGIVGLIAVLGPATASIGSMSNAIGVMTGTVLPALQTGFSTVFSFIASNPIVLLTTAIVGFVALVATSGDEILGILNSVDSFLQNVFATDWTNIFGPVLGEALNSFFANLKNVWDSIKQIFTGIIDFVRGVFTGDWTRAWNGIKEVFSGVFNSLTSIAKAPINGVIGLLNMAISAVNSMIKGFNKIGIDLPDFLGGWSWHPNIPTIPDIAYLAKGGILSSGTAVVGEAGPEILTMVGNKAVVQPLSGSATAGNGLSDITSLLSAYLPYLAQSSDVVLDSGEIVGAIGSKLNDEMGRIEERERSR